MKSRCSVIAVCLTLSMVLPVQAEDDQSADYLRKQCKRAIDAVESSGPGMNSYEAGYCFATLRTSMVFIGWLERDHGNFYDIKIPPNATISQATRVFLTYADKHPELLHKNQIELLLDSWREAWPATLGSQKK